MAIHYHSKTEIEAGPEGRHFGGAGTAALAHVPGAEAECRNALAPRQDNRLLRCHILISFGPDFSTRKQSFPNFPSFAMRYPQ